MGGNWKLGTNGKGSCGKSRLQRPCERNLSLATWSYIKLFRSKERPALAARQCQTLHFVKRPPPLSSPNSASLVRGVGTWSNLPPFIQFFLGSEGRGHNLLEWNGMVLLPLCLGRRPFTEGDSFFLASHISCLYKAKKTGPGRILRNCRSVESPFGPETTLLFLSLDKIWLST